MSERTANEAKRGKHRREEGNAIGLTEAFAPVDDDGFGRLAPERSWLDEPEPSGDGAVQGDAGFAEAGAQDASEDEGALTVGEEAAASASDAPDAGGRVSADPADVAADANPVDLVATDDSAALAASEAAPAREKRGRHARHAAPAADVAPGEVVLVETEVRAARRRGKRSAEEVPGYVRKSRRTRNILLTAIALLVVLGLAGGVMVWQLVQTAQTAAQEQAAHTGSSATSLQDEASDDAATVSSKKASAPDLLVLLGLTQDAALSRLGEGAQLSSAVQLNAAGERLGEGEELAFTECTVSLTAGESDARMGYPSVYLTCDKDGTVIRAGYSATTTLLGFGSQSFKDVVENGRIVEATLEEAGVSAAQGSVELPADKAAYTTYAEDGVTPVMEHCSFSGEAQAGGSTLQWSAVLSYDYSMYNVTGNLNDTVRVIYVYVE